MQEGLYFEDLTLGRSSVTRSVQITQDDIVEFALKWDPQPFHLDEHSAANSIFNGLVGSGLQTLLISYKLFFDHGMLRGTIIAGLGLDFVKFRQPVRPGQSIKVVGQVAGLWNTNKPGRGRVQLDFKTLNDREDVVMTFSMNVLVRCRSNEVDAVTALE
jgi:acyl dehydratase